MKKKYINISTRFLSGLMLICAITISGCKNSDDVNLNQESSVGESDNTTAANRSTGQYIVVFKDSKPGTVGQAADGNSPLQMEANRILKDKGVQELTVAPTATFNGITTGFLAKLSPEQVNALKNDPIVLHVEEDRGFVIGQGGGKPKATTTTTTTTTPTTSTGGTSTTCGTNAGGTQPAQSVPWGVTAVGGAGTGVGKTAWIVDTGIDFNHPDLTVDATRSRSFLYSYNTATNYASSCDEHGHGTSVAGIIGAKNNTIGVVGVAAGATLVSVRAMDKNGYGYVSSVINAINYIAANAKPGDVANFSISFGASSTMDDAIRNLAAKGVIVVAGSGNSGADCSTCSPARVDAPNVYTISGMNSSEVFVSNSNYGKAVDYCAPGADILTTGLNGTYIKFGGTSAATAHGSGVLLATGGQPKHFTFVKCDPDPYTDPIIHRHPKP